MKTIIILKGKATKETFAAIDEVTKSNFTKGFEKFKKVLKKGSKIILVC